jgi:hypothetical protein
MATAEDLDHATDSQWDWVAEHTRTYLASGGAQGHESNGVQVGPRRFTARARVASPAERPPLWAQMAKIFPLYDEYAQKTARQIPIVLLTPQAEPR